jgi:hypothetical protein
LHKITGKCVTGWKDVYNDCECWSTTICKATFCYWAKGLFSYSETSLKRTLRKSALSQYRPDSSLHRKSFKTGHPYKPALFFGPSAGRFREVSLYSLTWNWNCGITKNNNYHLQCSIFQICMDCESDCNYKYENDISDT